MRSGVGPRLVHRFGTLLAFIIKQGYPLLNAASPAPTALITGAARRIGRAIAEDLARHGWRVVIHHNNSHAEAADLAASITRAGSFAAVVSADLADPEAPARVVAAACAAAGPLSLLVNNASTFERDVVGTLDRALWDRQFAVNLAAPVFLAEAFAAQLPAGAEGNVVNILDQRIWRPRPTYVSYQLTKNALFTATETLAQALAPRVRVNGIAPGPVLPNPGQSAERFATHVKATPLGRAPDLADFGRTVRYFVENRSVTGTVIALDSGQHLVSQALANRPREEN
jgi:NAD(P)-dependent dehydrogenase (short-subunit alcohol dehydrogenase family)